MITRKDIILDSNPLLREKSVDVQLPLSKEDEELLDKMMEYLETRCWFSSSPNWRFKENVCCINL